MTNMPLPDRKRARDRQTVIGLTLAAGVIVAWLVAHVSAIYLINWPELPWIAPVAMVAVQTWLFVGLFIIAHDCMHGSLAPGRPAINRTVGRLCLLLYAGFSYDGLLKDHHKHHRRPGTEDDPDYNPHNPHAFWPWFVRFMRHYFGWRQFLTLGVGMVLYVVLLRPSVVNLTVFFALPSILSALQLFYFGTYRPHRHENDMFADEHRTRTDNFPWLVSLLTCFHFGYHHEHHLAPTVPWWQLPAVRKAQAAGSGALARVKA
ncbi:fatty acid desaturase [Acuticoccus sp. MNP-M23]|uniref:fatty acid desaturase n=1 Tax=Acuticoccus sp. MNP-M23 TaxID=3072793 RepID=UPI002815F62F|nr:fatty acid desaturase [Acuticoccus sp. MNP-M23]WMS43368.1 fatty acid desaturase [Acuticoccus sp. MNP-M23]